MNLVKRIKSLPDPTCFACMGTGFAGSGNFFGDPIVDNLQEYTCSCCVEYVPASSPEPKSDDAANNQGDNAKNEWPLK